MTPADRLATDSDPTGDLPQDQYRVLVIPCSSFWRLVVDFTLRLRRREVSGRQQLRASSSRTSWIDVSTRLAADLWAVEPYGIVVDVRVSVRVGT